MHEVRKRSSYRVWVLAGAIAMALPPAMEAQAQAPAAAGARQQAFDIPAGPLAQALSRFSEQSGLQVLYEPDLAQGKQVAAFRDTAPAESALSRLLQGSGLKAEPVNDRVVVIRKAEAVQPPPPSRQAPRPQARSADEDEPVTELRKLTVTGTRIKGAELTSPLMMITQEDMRLAGHPSLGDALRVLPQNFSGGQNPGVTDAGGGITNQNVTSGSSFNLRGLGPDATLTLLNGARLTYDSFFQAVDIDAIPVAAVDRVEVLLDGASSIYGSDAVAGVVNVILKRDYSGAEVSARLGTSTSGGYTQAQYAGVAGTTWDSGGFILTTSVSRNTPVSSGQRAYLADQDPDNDIYPNISQKNAVLSGHQQLGESTELNVDGFYSDRSAHHYSLYPDGRDAQRNGATSWGIYPSLNFSLRDDMSLRLHAALGESKSRWMFETFSRTTGESTGGYREYYQNKNVVVGVEFNGAFARLPGGSIGYALGGGYRENGFSMDYASGQEDTVPHVGSESSRSRYAYGEIDVPLVGPDNAVPFVRQLSINGAVRHERYDSFGRTSTPKLGAFWSVNSSLDIKASWGRSFKAPTLLQLYQPRYLIYDPSGVYEGAPEDRTIMVTWGGNPDLGPEKATVATAGFVFKPEFLAGTSVELNWFDIKYSNRVMQPHRSIVAALVDPSSADYRIINPSLEQINHEFDKLGIPRGEFMYNSANPDFSPRPWDPNDVHAIVESRYMNAAENKISGIDLTARYAMDLSGGILTLSGNGNWITNSTRTVNALAPELTNAGMIFTPVKFRGRIAAAWSRETFAVSTAINHAGGVLNDLITPPVKGGSMTSVDLVLDYWVDSERLGELGINLGMINIFNQRPPYAERRQPYQAPYDATNYSALGRVVNLTLTKRF